MVCRSEIRNRNEEVSISNPKNKIEALIEDTKQQISLKNSRLESLKVSIQNEKIKLKTFNCIRYDNLECIERLISSKNHQLVLNSIFHIYKKIPDSISFLYNQFNPATQFKTKIEPPDEQLLNEMIERLIKEIPKKKRVHVTESDWYENKKKVKEQGESNW